MCPIRPNVVWALDFQFDQISDGKMLEVLNVVGELTREALAGDVERSIDAVRCLERLAAGRGAPVYVRFDNGPGFIAHAVNDWCRFNGTGTAFIDPGSPWQSAWIESFIAPMRDEHLDGQQFESLLEAQALTEDWWMDYNIDRPSQRTRLAHPGRVRRGLAPPTRTPTRMAGGSTIGVPSGSRRQRATPDRSRDAPEGCRARATSSEAPDPEPWTAAAARHSNGFAGFTLFTSARDLSRGERLAQRRSIIYSSRVGSRL